MGELSFADVTPLSLRARLGIALCLFAGYCRSRRLDHREIDSFVEHLWRFIDLSGTREAFDRWSAEEPPLLYTALGYEYPPGFVEVLSGMDVRPEEFRSMLESTAEILYTSLFGAASDSWSRLLLGRVSGVACPLGVSWPDLDIFACSRWSCRGGWGEVPTPAELVRWRKAATA